MGNILGTKGLISADGSTFYFIVNELIAIYKKFLSYSPFPVGDTIKSEKVSAICVNYANNTLVIYDTNKMLKYFKLNTSNSALPKFDSKTDIGNIANMIDDIKMSNDDSVILTYGQFEINIYRYTATTDTYTLNQTIPGNFT
jgi:hypothetical protein